MIELDISKFKSKPFDHQVDGVKALITNSSFALFDQMGAGKSKQVIDAACTLAANSSIDCVVIVAPASVRSVWLAEEDGEIKKHAWVPSAVYEFHKNVGLRWESYDLKENSSPRIAWFVTNYEYLRNQDHLARLMGVVKQFSERGTMLVLDESVYVKSRTSQQTKSLIKLRAVCDRCVLLNGTPITKDPLDLWAQFLVLDKKILADRYKNNFYFFRSTYAEMCSQSFRGRSFQSVTRFKNIDKLSAIVAPYVLRRLKKDCLDLPDKIFTTREVELSEPAWRRYQTLRKEAIVALECKDKEGNEMLRLEPNSGVRLMRLSQLTSGFLGGSDGREEGDVLPVCLDYSSEKIDWLREYLQEETEAKALIVWCRWRRERERIVEMINGLPAMSAFQVYGGQTGHIRELAIQGFKRFAIESPGKSILVAQPQAGGYGLNLQVATEAIYMSNTYSLGDRLQSEDRCHRPGQIHNVTYIDVLACGPEGQKTIDHLIVGALKNKMDLSTMTYAQWRKDL